MKKEERLLKGLVSLQKKRVKTKNTSGIEEFFVNTMEDENLKDLLTIQIFINFFKFKRNGVLKEFTNKEVRVTINKLPPGITPSDFTTGIMHPTNPDMSDHAAVALVKTHFKLDWDLGKFVGVSSIQLYNPTKPYNTDWVGNVIIYRCYHLDKILLIDECEIVHLVQPKTWFQYNEHNNLSTESARNVNRGNSCIKK